MRNLPFFTSALIAFLFGYVALCAAHLYALQVTQQALSISSPWSSIPHAFGWIKTHPDVFMKWSSVLGIGLGISFFAFGVTFHRLRANKPVMDMHGSARFAKESEVEALGLLDNKGVFVGGYEGNYLRHDGGEHIQVVAPTRAGKGVSIVIPTLLTWHESALITDIKGELWELTSGWRKVHAKNKCYKLDFGDLESAQFNVLDTMSIGTPRELSDAQNIASILVDPDGKGMDGRDGHWRKAAHALISGIIVYAVNSIQKPDGEIANLNDVANLLTPPDREFEDVLEEMIFFDDDAVADEICRFINASARQHAARKGEEAASVLSTAANYLVLFKDPMVARACSRSDFSVLDLVNDAQPISVYITVKPSDKARLLPVIRLLLTVIVRTLTRDLDFKEGRAVSAHSRRLLLMLDEFPALGKLDVMTDTLAYMSSYGLKTMMIIQNYNQLWSMYGRNESLTANCHVRVVFAPNIIETAREVSSMTGQKTVVKREKHGDTKIKVLAPLDDKFNEVGRPLMTAEEVMRLKSAEKQGNTISAPGELLVFVAGNHVIRGTQPLYFQDKYLNARAKVGNAA